MGKGRGKERGEKIYGSKEGKEKYIKMATV